MFLERILFFYLKCERYLSVVAVETIIFSSCVTKFCIFCVLTRNLNEPPQHCDSYVLAADLFTSPYKYAKYLGQALANNNGRLFSPEKTSKEVVVAHKAAIK